MNAEPEMVGGPNRRGGALALVIAVTSMTAVMLYLDRFCISIMEAYIPEDLGLTRREWAWVLGAFFYAYALAQVPTGWLSDRFGPRRMLTVYLIGWSACTAATGLAAGFTMLMVARLACGLTQAGAYPTAAILMRQWVPVSGRGKANSLVTLGGRIGGALAAPLTALLLVALLPTGTPSRIAPSDLLRPKELAEKLNDPGKDAASPFRRAVAARLTPRELAAAARLADASKPAPADMDAIDAGLNRLLDDQTLAEALGAARNALPREAVAILAVPAGHRSQAETERLVRLALEVAFPGAIRQLYGHSWRKVLNVYGAIGIVVALLFWVVVRDEPPRPAENQATPAVVDDEVGNRSRPAAGDQILRRLVSSRNIWLVSLVQFCVNIGWIPIVTLLPSYLKEVFRIPLEERGRMMAVPLLVGCVGMFIGGWLTDRLLRSLGLRWGRAVPIVLTQVGCAAAVLACPWLPSAWAVIAGLSLMAMLTDIGVPALWAFMQDVGGRNAGAALGWGNMCGNLGAAISPLFLTWIQERAGWNAVFAVCSGAFLVGALAGLGLHAERPLAKS